MSTEELNELKKRADLLGIKYGPNISVATLKTKIEEALSEDNSESEQDAKPASKDILAKRKEANKLIRCIITCLNPAKKSLPGEFFKVSNRVVGTITKYIPYNVPYHVPKIIFDQIKAAKCIVFVPKKNSKEDEEFKLISEYGVEVLPPLTQKELDELARSQARAGATLED